MATATHPDPPVLEAWCRGVPSSEEERSHYRYRLFEELGPPPFEEWVIGFRAHRRQWPWFTKTEHQIVCDRCGFVEIVAHDDYVCQTCRKALDERTS